MRSSEDEYIDIHNSKGKIRTNATAEIIKCTTEENFTEIQREPWVQKKGINALCANFSDMFLYLFQETKEKKKNRTKTRPKKFTTNIIRKRKKNRRGRF